MKYLDYFRLKIQSVALSSVTKTVESLLIRLFSAFTELVEAQINFLHQSNKLHLVNNAIPLLQFIRGNYISVVFNQPNIYQIDIRAVATDADDTWGGVSLNDFNASFVGLNNNSKLLNTVLIPATDSVASDTISTQLYDVSDTIFESFQFNDEEYFELTLPNVWSESIGFTLNGIRWKSVKYVREATKNSYLITLNEFRQPVIIFLENRPLGVGTISYRLTDAALNTSFNLRVTTISADETTLVTTITGITGATGTPSVNQLKNIVRLYYENNKWTPTKVVDTTLTVSGVTKAKFIRISKDTINIQINTIDNALDGYLGLVFNALEEYLEYSGEELIVTLASRTSISALVSINGVETANVATLLTNYFSFNTVLKLGDIYELIEKNIIGSSQILSLELTPIIHVEELTGAVFAIINTKVIQTITKLQLIAVSSDQCYVYQIDTDNISTFIGLVNNNGLTNLLTLNDGTTLQVTMLGVLDIGAYNLYEVFPSVLTAGEITPDYGFTVGTIQVIYV